MPNTEHGRRKPSIVLNFPEVSAPLDGEPIETFLAVLDEIQREMERAHQAALAPDVAPKRPHHPNRAATP